MSRLFRLRIGFSSSRATSCFTLFLAAALLGGCSLSPGVRFTEHLPNGAAASSADAPPPGAIREITPDLIRQLRDEQARDVPESVKRLFGTAQSYRIGSADVLNIVVWNHPDLNIPPAGSLTTDVVGGSPVSNGYNVSTEGMIQFPYLGDVKVLGMTESEARDELTKRLSKYLNRPNLTVRIQSYRNRRVYIDGAVRTPGLQLVNDLPMTLPEAINRAGGFAQDADRSAILISRGEATVAVNQQQLTSLGINPNKIILSSGDLVRVLSREDTKVYVLGEVTKPVAQMLRDGRLSLNEALGEAGGISTETGDPRQVYVVRAGSDPQKPQVFHLDMRSSASYALSDGFPLQARDVVYVDPSSFVRWNRVVNLVMPTMQAVYNSFALRYYINHP